MCQSHLYSPRPVPGLQIRIGLEFEFRNYLNCRTYTVPWTFELTACLIPKMQQFSENFQMLHLGKIPKKFGWNLAKNQQNSSKICELFFFLKEWARRGEDTNFIFFICNSCPKFTNFDGNFPDFQYILRRRSIHFTS